MTARLIVIEGIDQSGKHTQTQLLATKLRKHGYKTRILSFPNYHNTSGKILQLFLTGKKSLPSEAVHMLYSLNRWEDLDEIKKALRSYDILLMDRYIPSNIAYGVAKGIDRKWLQTLDKGLPQPDTVIVLSIPVTASFNRKRKGRDVHEKNRRFIMKVDRTYRELSKRYGWTIIEAASSTIEQVHNQIWTMTKRILQTPYKNIIVS